MGAATGLWHQMPQTIFRSKQQEALSQVNSEEIYRLSGFDFKFRGRNGEEWEKDTKVQALFCVLFPWLCPARAGSQMAGDIGHSQTRKKKS